MKVKSEKPAAALSNKLYYVLNNETIAPSSSSKSSRDNHRSTGINIVPVNNANSISNRKQQSTITYNKNQSQTRSTYSNHERLPTQISHRTSPIVKNTTTTPRVRKHRDVILIIKIYFTGSDNYHSSIDNKNNKYSTTSSSIAYKSKNCYT